LPDQVGTGVRRILADDAFALRAARMRDVYTKLDAGAESAGLIEALADTRLPVTRQWARR
jgi:hypothetical protein